MVIKVAIINSDKLSRSQDDLYLGVTFLEGDTGYFTLESDQHLFILFHAAVNQTRK